MKVTAVDGPMRGGTVDLPSDRTEFEVGTTRYDPPMLGDDCDCPVDIVRYSVISQDLLFGCGIYARAYFAVSTDGPRPPVPYRAHWELRSSTPPNILKSFDAWWTWALARHHPKTLWRKWRLWPLIEWAWRVQREGGSVSCEPGMSEQWEELLNPRPCDAES